MKRLGLGFFLIFICIQAFSACYLTDDQGRKIILKKPAQRVISLSPDLTEIIFAIGGGKQLVGVVSHSDYPKEAQKVPVVANFNYLNAEAILRLHPDLIVAWESAHFKLLQQLGIPVYYVNPQTLLDIPKTILALGCLLGQEKNAQNVHDIFLKKYAKLQQKYATNSPKKVFFQVWSSPLMTISKKSWINDALALCGGENIFADLPGAAPVVNREAVIRINPDAMIGTTDSHWQKEWQSWPELKAVKNHALFSVNPDVIERANPRILQGVEAICQDLQ